MIARIFSGPREMTDHEACLARIDALERELFPEWFLSKPVRSRAEALIRLSWKQDPKNGGLVPSEREAVTYASAASAAISLAPGAMWPVQDHDDIRHVPAKNYTQIMGEPKKRIILP